MRAYFIFFILLFTSSLTFAVESCPSVKDIYQNNLHGWTAYTNDNGTILDSANLYDFEQTIGRFNSARWIDSALEGESHCYYTNNTGDYAIAFLAKDHLKPDPSSSYWHLQYGDPVCESSTFVCLFVDK